MEIPDVVSDSPNDATGVVLSLNFAHWSLEDDAYVSKLLMEEFNI